MKEMNNSTKIDEKESFHSFTMVREDFKKKNGIFYDIGIKGGRGKATNHNWKLVFNYDIRSLWRGNKKQCHN